MEGGGEEKKKNMVGKGTRGKTAELYGWGPERLAGRNGKYKVKIWLRWESFWGDEMFWNQTVMITTKPCYKYKCSSNEDGLMS